MVVIGMRSKAHSEIMISFLMAIIAIHVTVVVLFL